MYCIQFERNKVLLCFVMLHIVITSFFYSLSLNIVSIVLLGTLVLLVYNNIPVNDHLYTIIYI